MGSNCNTESSIQTAGQTFMVWTVAYCSCLQELRHLQQGETPKGCQEWLGTADFISRLFPTILLENNPRTVKCNGPVVIFADNRKETRQSLGYISVLLLPHRNICLHVWK